MDSRLVCACAAILLGAAAWDGGVARAQQPATDADPSQPAVSIVTPAPATPAQMDSSAGNSVYSTNETSEEAAPRAPVTETVAKVQPPPGPPKPLRSPVAILRVLDKVTAETLRFEAPVGRPVRYKTLIFTVNACETTAPDEDASDAAAHVEIDSQPNGPDGKPVPTMRRVFNGWMFANAPGLNLFQHPVYDAWLIACKAAPPSA